MGPSSLQKGHTASQFSAHVCCGKTAGWINMPLGTEVGLGPGHIVLDEIQLPPHRGTAPNFWPIFIAAKQSPIWATAENFRIRFTTDISHTFCRSATKFGRVTCLHGQSKLIPRISWTLLWRSRGTIRRHASVLHWSCIVVFDNFPVFSDRFSVLNFFLGETEPIETGGKLRQSIHYVVAVHICLSIVVLITSWCVLSMLFY